MSRRARLVGPLWRWHRRIGLLAALLLLLLSVSGFVLNHGDDLNLDKRMVESRFLRGLYGDAGSAWPAYRLDSRWLTLADNGVLFLDEHAIGECTGALAGALQLRELLVIACSEELLLLSGNGELIDKLDSATGLLLPLGGLARNAGHILVHAAGQWRVFDPDTMSLAAPLPEHSMIERGKAAELPLALRERLDRRSAWLSWERLMLDLHSGRLFGRIGVLVVDIAGLLFCLLALSGVTMWGLHRKK